MSTAKITLLEECLGEFGFLVKYEHSEYWTDVTVWEVILRGPVGNGNVPIFNRKGWQSSPDPVYATNEAERYLEGFIKWDGCSEFTFAPDRDDNVHHVHWCGPNAYRRHFHLLEHIYRRAQEMMAKSDAPWETS